MSGKFDLVQGVQPAVVACTSLLEKCQTSLGSTSAQLARSNRVVKGMARLIEMSQRVPENLVAIQEELLWMVEQWKVEMERQMGGAQMRIGSRKNSSREGRMLGVPHRHEQNKSDAGDGPDHVLLLFEERGHAVLGRCNSGECSNANIRPYPFCSVLSRCTISNEHLHWNC
jgi:hypothetical protein